VAEDSPQQYTLNGLERFTVLWLAALNMQEERLLHDSPDGIVDSWFAMVAIRNALRLARLVARALSHSELNKKVETFDASVPARSIRDVLEHFDRRLFGDEADAASMATTFEMTYDDGRLTVRVTSGSDAVDLPAAFSGGRELLLDTLAVVRAAQGRRRIRDSSGDDGMPATSSSANSLT
jgi:hypothetical protein